MTTTNLDPSSIPLPTRRRPRFGETGLRALTAATALLLVAIMVLLVYETTRQAWPSIQEFGLGFVTSDQWNVVTDQFGALNLIIGTLLTSVVALVIAVPMAIAIGLFLSELAPRVLRTPVGMMVELLAAIPSVVLGLWGILVMGPFLARARRAVAVRPPRLHPAVLGVSVQPGRAAGLRGADASWWCRSWPASAASCS